MIQILEKNIGGENLILTNQNALFWKREKALILSDLHIGKTAHFRKNGIAIPSTILNDDLQKLQNLIQFFSAEKLIIVGDFLHAGNNSDIDLFCEWRNQFPDLEIILIKGNHDKISEMILQKICVKELVEELHIEPFTFIHEPKNSVEKFCISGHIHPGILWQNKIQRLKLPCFAISGNQLILPAFSKFTGLDYKTLSSDFTKIAFIQEHIFEI